MRPDDQRRCGKDISRSRRRWLHCCITFKSFKHIFTFIILVVLGILDTLNTIFKATLAFPRCKATPLAPGPSLLAKETLLIRCRTNLIEYKLIIAKSPPSSIVDRSGFLVQFLQKWPREMMILSPVCGRQASLGLSGGY